MLCHEAHASISRTCIICYEDTTASRFPTSRVTAGCTHAPSTCLICLEKTIREELSSRGWDLIQCPECPSQLDYNDVHRFADTETFHRYETLSLRSALNDESTFVWCCGPGCDSGQMHEGGLDQPIVRCNACKFRSCFRHRGPWHEALTCEEFETMQQDPDNFKSAVRRTKEEYRPVQEEEERADAEMAAELVERQRVQLVEREAKRVADEKASLRTVQLTTKTCPGQGCNWNIEKNNGCAHMTCIKCRHEFCWVCKKAWRTGHTCRC